MDEEPIKIDISLTNLPEDTEYIIKKRFILNTDGSLLYEWARLHYESDLQPLDFQYLQETCVPRMYMEFEASENGTVSVHAELQANEVVFINIHPRIR